MIRIWLLFFVLALGVAFKLFNPTQWVAIPFPIDYTQVPKDVFYYHLFEHFGNIIVISILISTIFYPVERKHLGAYAAYLIIEVVDMILYRLYYRGWMIQSITWNELKTVIFGIITICYQWKIR